MIILVFYPTTLSPHLADVNCDDYDDARAKAEAVKP